MNGGIGTSGSPLTTATIVGGCSGGNPAPHPCSSTDNVYATVTLAHGANMQAAAYAVDDVLLASGTALWGPAAARSVTISEDAGTWQPIVKLPPGAPGGSGVVPIPGTWRG